MSSEYDTKSVLLDLMKEGENKTCVDCDVPMPQWASLSFGVFVCLTCSGHHRGLGVHVSFVRSITMDKWTEAQITKMRTGGNEKCRKFFESSPAYSKNMSIQDKYTSHFAAQYKDKLLAEIEGRTWVPSDTPAPTVSSPSGLRKPRISAATRGASPAPGRSDSPQSAGGSGSGISSSQKAANEDFFASMGARNESRSADVPPSQGGKYAGFGSDSSYNPSTATSSRALPGFDDIRSDPVSALSRGWGFFGAALSQASKAVNESVVQPTLERAVDPNLQSQLSSYVNKAGSVLGEASRRGGEALASGLHTGGDLIRRDLGYNVGDLGATYVERITGRGAGQGYGQVGTFEAPSADEHDDFFGNHMGGSPSESRRGYSDNARGGSPGGSNASTPPVTSSRDYGSSSTPATMDTWASLAPQSVARGGGTPTGGATSSKLSSGRSSPAVKAPVQKKSEKEEWDEW